MADGNASLVEPGANAARPSRYRLFASRAFRRQPKSHTIPMASGNAGLRRLRGEFDNEDVIGLAAHASVTTDCEVRWSDGHGKTYCFATPPSFLEFKDHPKLLQQAEASWRQPHPPAR